MTQISASESIHQQPNITIVLSMLSTAFHFFQTLDQLPHRVIMRDHFIIIVSIKQFHTQISGFNKFHRFSWINFNTKTCHFIHITFPLINYELTKEMTFMNFYFPILIYILILKFTTASTTRFIICFEH